MYLVNQERISEIESFFKKKLKIENVENTNVYLSLDDIKRLKAERSRLKSILRVVSTEDAGLYKNLLNIVENELNI